MNFRSLAALAAAAILTCAAPARAAESTVVISQGVDADTLDPIKVSVTTSTNVHNQIFNMLARRDPSGKLIPDLAVSWKRTAPTVWEFKLRRGVQFSNGDPFTSADVKFTIEKILDPAYRSQQVPRVDTVARVETSDPYTARLVTKKPTPIPPAITRPIFIVDAKYWQAHNDGYMPEHPIGTGPYVLREWRKDELIALDANPKYFGGPPAIAHVVFKPVPEGAARVAALKTGAADLITNVPFQFALSLAGGQNTQMTSAKSVRVLYIAFNLTKPGPQNNRLLRQALNYAVDVPAIIKAVLGGRAYELGEPVPPNFFGYDPKLALYKHDDAKARDLLAKAGFPDGKGLELTINTPTARYNGDKEVALAVAGQLQKYGIKVDVKPQEWVSYYRQANQKMLAPMYELAWGNITYDADNTLASLFASEATVSAYSNPALDKLIDDARYELDAKKRAAIYSRAMRIIHDDAPWLFLFQYEDLYATSKRLAWQARGDEAIYCYDMRLK
ncbi:MAG: ABC transporter substrate-binding protein [Candidatus Velthaea sp.]